MEASGLMIVIPEKEEEIGIEIEEMMTGREIVVLVSGLLMTARCHQLLTGMIAVGKIHLGGRLRTGMHPLQRRKGGSMFARLSPTV